MANKIDQERVRQALGSSRVESVPGLPSRGPLDLLQLQEHFQSRLRSSGGRPADPERTLTRAVRFRPERWSELEQLAAMIGPLGRTVSPAQLAATLIEQGIDKLSNRVPQSGSEAPAGRTPLVDDAVFVGLRSPTDCLEHAA
jgi:hypothetical protein